MSCRIASIDEFAKTTPVSPPTVNKNINPSAHIIPGLMLTTDPYMVASQLNTLMPVGTAMIMVADVK